MPRYTALTQICKKVIEPLIHNSTIKATKYILSNFVIKANSKRNKRGNTEIIITIGKPNFQERRSIKQAIKAGEPFPIKKIQLKER